MQTSIVLIAAPPARKRAHVFRIVAWLVTLVVFLGAVFVFSADALLNRFLRPKLERTFAAHVAGASLHLGALHYDFWADRLEFHSLAMHLRNGSSAQADSISATGLHWAWLLLDKPTPAHLFRGARLEATDFSVVFAAAQYRVQCRLIEASVADSSATAHGLTLQPTMSDEDFFASSPYRRVRYRLAIVSAELHGLDFATLLDRQGYHAQSLTLTGAAIDTLVDREKPRRPLLSPPMPHELLAAIAKPFRLDDLDITRGLIRFASRRSATAQPGVLTFTAVHLGAKEIANAAAGGQTIDLRAEGRLMDAGTMTVRMRVPVAPAGLAFHYSGELTAMDLTRLDEFMNGAGRIQIKSGNVSEVAFDIDVENGRAHGLVRGVYQDLHVKVVDGNTGSEKGVVNRVATVLTDTLKVRKDNTPERTGALKAGKVDYVHQPEESFLQFAWLALRTGLVNLVSFEATAVP